MKLLEKRIQSLEKAYLPETIKPPYLFTWEVFTANLALLELFPDPALVPRFLQEEYGRIRTAFDYMTAEAQRQEDEANRVPK